MKSQLVNFPGWEEGQDSELHTNEYDECRQSWQITERKRFIGLIESSGTYPRLPISSYYSYSAFKITQTVGYLFGKIQKNGWLESVIQKSVFRHMQN